jgi:hypothetical protein
MDTHKLHHEMQVFLTRHRIKLGRDRLHALLKENGMLAKRKAHKVTTTQSNHTHFKYPNKVKNVIPSRANELWVSDLTYILVGPTYAYLYIIMDAFSRKIVAGPPVRLVFRENDACSRGFKVIEYGFVSSERYQPVVDTPFRSGRSILLLSVRATITSSECHHQYD